MSSSWLFLSVALLQSEVSVWIKVHAQLCVVRHDHPDLQELIEEEASHGELRIEAVHCGLTPRPPISVVQLPMELLTTNASTSSHGRLGLAMRWTGAMAPHTSMDDLEIRIDRFLSLDSNR